MLSDSCQQGAIASRQICGPLEGAIGAAVGIPQGCAVLEPCPRILRSDGQQRFDCLFGILEPQELELDSRKNQAQFRASWATLHRRRGNGLSVRISKVLQQELGKREAGSGVARFCRDCLTQQILGLHAPSRCGDPRWLPDIEPPVADKRRAQAGERRGVAIRSPMLATGPPVPPTAPTICCRPRLEGPLPTTR